MTTIPRRRGTRWDLHMTDTEEDARRLVREGYDRIAQRYFSWNLNDVQNSPAEKRFLPMVLHSLPAGTRCIDLGCGNGLPHTRTLTQHFKVIAVDFSITQLMLARQHAPQAHLLQADMTQLHFPSGYLDAAVALYSIIHIPREGHGRLFRRIASWLRSGGLFLVALMKDDLPRCIEDDWLGAPMFWSGHDPATNVGLIRNAGFEVLDCDIVTQIEDGEHVDFLWVLAKRL
jgi:SAM-dependent methyltransferase